MSHITGAGVVLKCKRITVQPPPPPPTVAGYAGIGGVWWGSSYPYQTNTDKYPVFSVSGGEETAAAGNPGIRLGYVPLMLSAGAGFGGVNYTEAAGTDMLLYTSDGVEVRGAGSFTNQRLTNPGNSAFQTAFVNDCRNFFTSKSLQGTFIDNFVTDCQQMGPIRVDTGAGTNYPYYHKNGTVAMSNATDWANAVIAFAQNAVKPLVDMGYYMMVNGAAFDDDASLTKPWVARYAPYVNAVALEYYMANPSYGSAAPVPTRASGTLYYQHWDEWIAAGEYVQNTLGLDLFGFCDVSTPVTDLQSARFTRASNFMAWNAQRGHSAWVWAANANVTTANNYWTTVHDINVGFPTGPRVSVGTGCWKRPGENFTVYVNPTANSQTLDGHSVPSMDAVFV